MPNETKPPDLLYLQWHGDGEPDDFGSVCELEVTHHRNRIFEHDILYLRVPDMTEREAWEAVQSLIEPDEDFNAFSDFIECVVNNEPGAVAVLLAASIQRMEEEHGQP